MNVRHYCRDCCGRSSCSMVPEFACVFALYANRWLAETLEWPLISVEIYRSPVLAKRPW